MVLNEVGLGRMVIDVGARVCFVIKSKIQKVTVL